MPRLKHATTGVVVDVAEEKVERLGNEWLSTDAPTEVTAEVVTEDEPANIPPAEVDGAETGEDGIPVLSESPAPKRGPGRPKKADAAE